MISERLVSRVGVDLDRHCGLELVKVYLRAQHFGAVTVFYTNHGFHVEVRLKRPVKPGAALDIRRMLCDDCDRLAVDEYRVNVSGDLRRFDTLFVGRLKGGEGFVRKEIRVL